MKQKPIVHCITNYVTANDCANILLAAGAAPIMAHHPEEVAEVTANADALVLNLGATDDFEAMKISIKTASEKGLPIVIDPVGVGGIEFRRKRFWELVKLAKPTCVRGNASEIRGLYENRKTARGIDISENDSALTDNSLTAKKGAENDLEMDEIVEGLARKLDCIVVASGRVDTISDGSSISHIEAGHEMMSSITGTGCMSSVLIGAFLSVLGEDTNPMKAVESAVFLMGKAGEVAGKRAEAINAGTMTFRQMLIDQISLYR